MNLWKKSLLSLYYHSSLPLRSLARWHRCRQGFEPISILFYHRIADDAATPWTLPNKLFQQQMDWLQQHFEIVSLQEAQHRMQLRHNSRPCVCITFDDGYADNCQQAIPYLVKQQIPCTYFVSTNHILTGQPFQHDIELGQPARPNSLDELKAMAQAGIEIGGHTATHADLGKITDPIELHEEMVESATILSKAIGRQIRYFAFPFGQHRNLSNAAFQLAKEAGFAGVCSAYGGFNFPGELPENDSFHLQRFAVDNDMLRLKNWVTIDPRKISKTQRFEYHLTDQTLNPNLQTQEV